MTRYVWRNGAFRNPSTDEPMEIPVRFGVAKPYVQSDISEYTSPIDGKPITSRSHRRYDLESNDCVALDPPKKKREYRNPKFALKHGLPLAEDVREKLEKSR